MEICENPTSLQGIDEQASFADLVDKVHKDCRECIAMTPITCLAGCRAWRLKNQFRNLYKIAGDPEFETKLINTVKSIVKLQLLETLAKRKYSSARLQQELKTIGFNCSKEDIVEKYITPLIALGLIQEDQDLYSATLFGRRVSELAGGSIDLGGLMPSHFGCYEEIVLNALAIGAKTREELEMVAPANGVARVLNHLQQTRLVERNQETEHIFFFVTRRDPAMEELSPTERRVYDNIKIDGISARKLAQKTSISLRRTYMYIRRLKGKKLVFARERPTSYWLTARGMQMTMILRGMHNLTAEVLKATAFLAEEKEINGQPIHH